MRAMIAALGALGLITLLVVPFHPEASLVSAVYHLAPPALEPYVWSVIELGGNFAGFAILAILLCLPLRPWHAFLVATFISAACEAAQIVIPLRQPSVSDFLLNTVGAAIGCVTYAGIARLAGAVARRRAAVRSAAA